MPAALYNLTIEQGADYSKSIVIRNADGSLRDLTGQSFRMQIREHYHSPTVLAQASLNVALANSRATFSLTAEQTSALDVKRAVYDLEMFNSSGNVLRLLKGSVDIEYEVTR